MRRRPKKLRKLRTKLMKEKIVILIRNCSPISMRNFKTSPSLRWLFKTQPNKVIGMSMLIPILQIMRQWSLIPLICLTAILLMVEETQRNWESGLRTTKIITGKVDKTVEEPLKLRTNHSIPFQEHGINTDQQMCLSI